MALSSVTVCLNALRLNLFKVHDSRKDKPLKKKALPAADYIYKEMIFPKEEMKMKETVKIEGMMCGHCEAAVKKSLEALDGVERAEVSHETGTAVLTLSKEIADADVRKAVEDTDYKFVSIEK